MNNNPIGIFDSGVGGLSILQSVRELLPSECFIYLADQKNYPYGGRQAAEIQKLALRAVTFLLSKKAKLIIIACNTASVNAIHSLRAQFDIPIIAVVPVVKTIAQSSKTKKAAVFATPATASSEYLADLIQKFSNGTQIYKIGNSQLEHLVEEGIINGSKVEEAIKDSLIPLIEKNVDSIALGCTHYPFVIPVIKQVVGSKINIYDSGGAIARRTEAVLAQENLASAVNGQDYFYTTSDAQKFKKVAEMLLRIKVNDVTSVEI